MLKMTANLCLAYYFLLPPFIPIVRVTASPPHKTMAPNRKNAMEVAVIYFTYLYHERFLIWYLLSMDICLKLMNLQCQEVLLPSRKLK